MKKLERKPLRQRTKKVTLSEEELLNELWEKNPELILAELFPNITRTLLIKGIESEAMPVSEGAKKPNG